MNRLNILALFGMLVLGGCGNTDVNMEIIGQAKRISHTTNLLCADYVSFDLSMGVMKNGTGSMSTQDIWFTVSPTVNVAVLQKAVADGSLVKVTANRRRAAFCTEGYIMTAAEITK